MPFKEGNEYGKGRPKGSKNKKKPLEELFERIANNNEAKFENAISKMNEKELVKVYMELAEYLIPKLARKEQEKEVEKQVYNEPSIIIDGQELTVKH